MPQEPAVHRAGALKQTNKLHKTGKHRSNRQIDNDNKGMVFENSGIFFLSHFRNCR